MLAVVKTPHTSIRIKGKIPDRLIAVLIQEYGKRVTITKETADEMVDVFTTAWYRKIKQDLTPGTYMKTFRQNHKMTQAELGKALGGLPRQHVSNMENGTRQISKKTALKLAELFGVSVDRFIG